MNVQDLRRAKPGPAEPDVACQLCCTLVGHLMVDMWIRADLTVATKLACSLLQRCGMGLASLCKCVTPLEERVLLQDPEIGLLFVHMQAYRQQCTSSAGPRD